MRIKSLYLVQINMKDGSKKYVSVNKGNRFLVVKNKKAAAKFLTDQQADIFSELFWQRAWDFEKYETRETIILKVEGGEG